MCEPPTYTHRVLNPLLQQHLRGRPYRFPNSPRQVVVPASDVLGCPVHRVQALELGPDELVAVGRDAECFTLAHAAQWHCERRVLLNGNVVVLR